VRESFRTQPSWARKLRTFQGTQMACWRQIVSIDKVQTMRNRRVSRCGLVCLAVILFWTLEFESPLVLCAKQLGHLTPSEAENPFSCINSKSQDKRKKRMIVLHGPDWALQSSISPSCLPEREVVFVTSVGQGLMPHAFESRTKLWVKSDRDITWVKIVESSGQEDQDMTAVSFGTNHKCAGRHFVQCRITGGPIAVRID